MRKNYIDNLRWIIIFLLIPYHAAMAWNAWGEPNYIYFESSRIISSFVVFLSPYFMPLMFLIAGISAKCSLQKRTFGQYIKERFKKLLIPFFIGTLLIMPIMTYFADKFNYCCKSGFFGHYLVFFTRFTDLTGADGGFSVGHFWFILYLFVISCVAVGIIMLQRRFLPQKRSVPFIAVCLMGLPLPLLSEVLSLGGKSLAEYMYIFLVGYYVFSDDFIIEKTEKHKWIFLFLGLFAAFADVYLFLWSEIKLAVLNTVAKYAAEWFMMPALLGLGKSYLNFDEKVTHYLSKISFSFYIFHFVWVVLFQYIFYSIFAGNTFLLYIMPVFFAYIVTFLCCELYRRAVARISALKKK